MGGNGFMKKTRSKKSRDTVPLSSGGGGGCLGPNKTTAKKRGPLLTYFIQGMMAVAKVTDDVILDVTIYKGRL
jgi:hypothetical protein